MLVAYVPAVPDANTSATFMRRPGIDSNLPFTEGVIVDGMRLEAKINQSFTKVKLLKIKGEKI